jgi:type IV pilus assembly protein PilX
MAPRERGMSLVIVLLILIVVSLLGVGGAQISMMGERSTRNDRDHQLAWQSAEAALVDAELDIDLRNVNSSTRNVFTPNNEADFVVGCGTTGVSRGLCQPATTGKPVWLTANLKAAPSVEFGTFTSRAFDAGAAGLKPYRKPRYVIEVLPDPEVFGSRAYQAEKRFVYRATAMGFGPREDIEAVVQMVIRKE